MKFKLLSLLLMVPLAGMAVSLDSVNPNPGMQMSGVDQPGGEGSGNNVQLYQGGDRMDDALPVVVGGSYRGTTVGFTDDFDAACPYTSYAAPDVLYRFETTEQGSYIFDLCDSNFDSKIYVLSEDGETIEGCMDDGCPDNIISPVLSISGLPAGVHYVVIDGYGVEAGEYTLTIRDNEDCEGVVCPDGALDEMEPNSGCNDDLSEFTTVYPGDVICGSVWSNFYERDTDWFHIHLETSGNLNIQVEAGFFNPVLALVTAGTQDCFDDVLAVMDAGVFCEPERLETDCLDAGDYYIFIAHNCWVDASGEYVLSVDFEECQTTSVVLPEAMTLATNYPNPFNPTTSIAYALPMPGQVSLQVYNVQGEMVSTLVNENQAAGNYEVEFNAGDLPSGTYFYRLTSGNETLVNKMLLLK